MGSSTAELKREQERTLARPRLRYGVPARLLFLTFDLLYGRKRTLTKFKILEVVARVPYQAWEHAAYIAITHKYASPDFARRIHERVQESRAQQDNEQWHLLILEEQVQKQGVRERFVLDRLVPQLLAFAYYQLSWLLYVVRPAWSYRLNAHFEDHAEHEYMHFVAENPDLEAPPFESIFEDDYGRFASLADLFRRIALDEREHMQESLDRIAEARFH